MTKETVKIQTLNENKRLSTQELLQLIAKKLKDGYTDFEIAGCGQHNIGGSSWSDEGAELTFKVTNPGQRVGAMALSGTKIVVEGSAPADAGWLNSGATIVVKGDCGDTAGHCMAGGKLYIAGRVGTRSGALMKHDPKYEVPELWVLKNTGSFSFEFTGGGVAVVCGYDCENLSSVLGHRSCVGMVGGTIFFRGNVEDIAPNVEITSLDDNDVEFLKTGMKEFLKETDRTDLYAVLTKFDEWKKIEPKKDGVRKNRMTVKEFREKIWVADGIFSDFIKDDMHVHNLASGGNGRLQIPERAAEKCIDCKICAENCPQGAINPENKSYETDPIKCIGCGICAAVCPRGVISMVSNIKEIS